VRLENADITGNSNVGSLVGYIINSNAAGNVTGTFFSVGGLVGSNDSGEITNSYAGAAVQGDYAVGGLVGGNSNGSIESCYATGIVSDIDVPDPESEGYFGGLVGRNHYEGEITNCYATGNVEGNCDVGGLVGFNSDGTVPNDKFGLSYFSIRGFFYVIQ
jgi:hypothetical protein